MDWTEYADLHQQFKDWREEAELLLNTVLPHIRNQETKLEFVSLWAGKEARTYLSTVGQYKKDSLKTMLDTLEDWTRPKLDEVAVFTQLRTLNQGNKTLSYLYPRSEESGRHVQFQLQGQADQKFHCSGSQQHQSISTVYFEGLQSHSKWMHQDLPNRGCHMQTGSSPTSRVYRLYWQYIHI